MKKDNKIKTFGKAVIILSSMAAMNEVIGYHASPYKSATGVRLMCNIAALSIGFFVGSVSADAVINSAELAYNVYKYGDIYSED